MTRVQAQKTKHKIETNSKFEIRMTIQEKFVRLVVRLKRRCVNNDAHN